jgi:hypothetical protein
MNLKDRRNNILHLLKKAFFASTMNIFLSFSLILLTGIISDGIIWPVMLFLSIVNSIIISNIIKYCYNYLLAIIFTIIMSITMYFIIGTISIKIEIIHNIIIKIFERISFHDFIGNYIVVMVFIFSTLLITIFLTLWNYTSNKRDYK